MADAIPFARSDLPRRCIGCAYVLEHLGSDGNCPECGRYFDLSDPSTYFRKPPIV